MNRTRALTLVAASIAGLLSAKVARAGSQPGDVAHAAASADNGELDARTVAIDVTDALDRARKNSTQFQAALTNAALARQDRTQARNACSLRLPTTIPQSIRKAFRWAPRHSSGRRSSSLRITAVHEYSARQTCTKSSMPWRLQIFAVWGQPPLLPKRRRKLRREGWCYRRTEFLRDIGRAAEKWRRRKDCGRKAIVPENHSGTREGGEVRAF